MTTLESTRRGKKSTVITIANHKGGVGKTTTAVTLATGLAEMGRRVLLVDCDPQGNCGQFLNIESAPGLYEMLVQQRGPASMIDPENPFQVILGDASTVDIETLLRTSPRFSPAKVLRDALGQYTGKYHRDVIIIDTAPSLSSIQIAALCAADWLIVPASPEYASETGIDALAQAVEELRAAGANLNLLGILPTLVDPRSKEHKQTILELRDKFPGLVLHPVRRLIAIAEAPRAGKSLWHYAPQAADDYAKVLERVINRAKI